MAQDSVLCLHFRSGNWKELNVPNRAEQDSSCSKVYRRPWCLRTSALLTKFVICSAELKAGRLGVVLTLCGSTVHPEALTLFLSNSAELLKQAERTWGIRMTEAKKKDEESLTRRVGSSYSCCRATCGVYLHLRLQYSHTAWHIDIDAG